MRAVLDSSIMYMGHDVVHTFALKTTLLNVHQCTSDKVLCLQNNIHIT